MVRRFSAVGVVGALLTVLLGVAAGSASGAPPVLTGAVSRQVHGSAGKFDIVLPLTGKASGIECRDVSGAGVTLILSFNQPVSGGSVAVTGGVAKVNGKPTFSKNQMTVKLAGVKD